jgi:hypothetical protein
VTRDVVQSLWDEHVAWSEAATRLKARRTRWSRVVLGLTIGGAALETLAASASGALRGVPLQMLAAGTGAVAFALVPFLSSSLLSPQDTRKWLRARSVSEGIKSEIFTFRAGAEPYDGRDALAALQEKVRGIQDSAKDMERERILVGSPTRPAPPPLDAGGYLEVRVRQQITDYYRPKAKQFAHLAQRAQTIGIVLAGLAAVLSAIVTVTGSAYVGPWIAVLTTVSGSVAAYAAGNRYDFQTTTFAATARQLEDLANAWTASGRPAPSQAWSELVRACEGAISAENRGWMAKLDEPA